MKIFYIRGEDNTIADALSHLPTDQHDADDATDLDISDMPLHWENWVKQITVNSVLTISADQLFLDNIHKGYNHDDFCKKLATANSSIQGIQFVNGLWYIGDRLIVPRYGTLREDLFCLAHDSLGHFGADKSYASIRDSYY